MGRGRVDALFDNKGGDVLIVSLHGALDRAKYRAPRFERYRSLKDSGYSVLYLSDPALALAPDLSLAWYVGYDGQDSVEACLEWIRRAADAIGAARIVVAGSSGGGFAALQITRHLPGSTALVFQPQTVLSKYYSSYVSAFAQERFPALGPNWEGRLGHRVSAVEAYREPGRNFVRYVQNRNDQSHYSRHYKPFIQARGLEAGREYPIGAPISVRLYDGPKGHKVPSKELFAEELEAAVIHARGAAES